MRTDHPFYQFMQAYPRQMFELLGISNLYQDDYTFSAPVVKETEFRPDGFYRGRSLLLPMIFVEVNFYYSEKIYKKTLAESWLIYAQTEPSPPEFYVFIIFDTRANAPGQSQFLEACMPAPYFKVIYLDEILNQLPENPYFTVLSLMVSKPDFEADIAKVKRIYQNIPPTEAEYFDLCVILLSYKYKSFSLNTIYAMLPSIKDELKQSLAIQQLMEEMYEQTLIDHDLKVTKQVLLQKELAVAQSLIEQSDFSAEKIALISGLSVDKVEELMKQTNRLANT